MAERAGVAVAVITRVPSPTDGKSRLRPFLGPRRCHELQQAFLLDTLAAVSAVEGPIVYVAHHPPEGGATLRRLLGPGAALLPQRGPNLGARLRHVASALLEHHRAVLLVGADSPTLQSRHVRAALLSLEVHDVCVGPALDGGYYLVGLKGGADRLFGGIDWGTDRVLAQTLRNVEAQGLRCQLLEPWYDVDTPSDLLLLSRHVAALAADPSALVPAHTRRLLEALLPATSLRGEKPEGGRP